MTKLNYAVTMWAEMKPDIYNDNKPQFETFCEGDRASEFLDVLTLDSKTFPPGTRIQVLLPCCPECGMDVEMCLESETCTFNWEEWLEDEYQ